MGRNAGFPDLETAKLALSVARESVVKQQADIRDLRTAAAALLTGDSVVVSFLGGRALDVHRFPLLVAAGVAFFVGSLVLVITVLIPSRRRGIKEIADGSELFDLNLDADEPNSDLYVRLTQTYDQIYEDNDRPKRRLVLRLVAAATLVVVQIAAWGVTIVLADHNAARPADTRLPTITGGARASRQLACSTGTWINSPTGFAYQWSRDQTPVQGAIRYAYTVRRSDEGLTLRCAVTASNADGVGSLATSAGVTVAVPHVARCPAATGELHGLTLGLVRLGITRAQGPSCVRAQLQPWPTLRGLLLPYADRRSGRIRVARAIDRTPESQARSSQGPGDLGVDLERLLRHPRHPRRLYDGYCRKDNGTSRPDSIRP